MARVHFDLWSSSVHLGSNELCVWSGLVLVSPPSTPSPSAAPSPPTPPLLPLPCVSVSALLSDLHVWFICNAAAKKKKKKHNKRQKEA